MENRINCNIENLDCISYMRKMDENSVDLTVTSPPYDNLRTYEDSVVWDWETFKKVAENLYRVTAVGGIVVWVVGDATTDGSETGTSFRQALYFMEIGFKLHDTMIYQKNNYMPLNHNRYDQCFEYMFVFSKDKPKTFNPLMVECATAGAKYNYATRSSATTREASAAIRARNEEKVTNTHKYRGNIWGYDTGKHKGSKDDIWEHPATFPEKLAEDHILSWSNEGDIIFDPFMGSGTTGKIALKNNRNFTGCELVKKYFNISTKRLQRMITMHDLVEM